MSLSLVIILARKLVVIDFPVPGGPCIITATGSLLFFCLIMLVHLWYNTLILFASLAYRGKNLQDKSCNVSISHLIFSWVLVSAALRFSTCFSRKLSFLSSLKYLTFNCAWGSIDFIQSINLDILFPIHSSPLAALHISVNFLSHESDSLCI